MKNACDNAGQKISGFQILLLILSVYAVAAVFVDPAFRLPPDVTSLLNMIDTGICVVFLWDFFHRLYQAENRWAFMRWGWIDLLSSIPMVGFFRWGRLVRVVRVLRILRGVRSARLILAVIFESRAKGTLSAVALVAAVLVIFSSFAILNAESTPEANIKNAGDALWWAVSTITTVGYGDRYPVTAEGRVIAALLMTAGVGLFGTFTAFIASFFVQGAKKVENSEADLAKEIRLLRERLESLETKLLSPRVTLPAQFGSAGLDRK